MQNTATAVAHFHREIRITPRLDAIKEVAVLTSRLGIQMDLVRPDFGVQNDLRFGLKASSPTAVPDPPLGSFESDVDLPRSDYHSHSIGVSVLYVIFSCGVI